MTLLAYLNAKEEERLIRPNLIDKVEESLLVNV